jgi:DNA-directed RNA polymerase subunit M/transcription elongation factor TFIIS
MTYSFKCPQCYSQWKTTDGSVIPSNEAGTRATCPKCKKENETSYQHSSTTTANSLVPRQAQKKH